MYDSPTYKYWFLSRGLIYFLNFCKSKIIAFVIVENFVRIQVVIFPTEWKTVVAKSQTHGLCLTPPMLFPLRYMGDNSGYIIHSDDDLEIASGWFLISTE